MLNISSLASRYNVIIKQMLLYGCRGVSRKLDDGYLILVDTNLHGDKLAKVLDHEFLHIILGHFDEHRDKPIDQKEQEVEDALYLLWVA